MVLEVRKAVIFGEKRVDNDRAKDFEMLVMCFFFFGLRYANMFAL